jgi:hypothetical protein
VGSVAEMAAEPAVGWVVAVRAEEGSEEETVGVAREVARVGVTAVVMEAADWVAETAGGRLAWPLHADGAQMQSHGVGRARTIRQHSEAPRDCRPRSTHSR